MRALLLLLAVSVCLPLFGGSEFPVLSQLHGVKQVELRAPFLIVVVRNEGVLSSVSLRAQEILKEDKDPDAAELKSPVMLRCMTSSSYYSWNKEMELIQSVDTVSKLQQVFEKCLFASVYELDWENPAVMVSRDRVFKWLTPPQEQEIQEEIDKVNGYINRMRKFDTQPEKLVYMQMPSVGGLVYPVFDGSIRFSGTKIDYEAFAVALPLKKKES